MPPSVVKNKIANFEAKNHDPSRSVVSTPTSSIVSGNSHEYDVDNDNVDATRTSTSVAASESRKSRIRQQILNPNQLQHPTDLMEKRNQIKERRSMLQQQQVQEENSFDNHDNTSSGRGMTLTRKTGYNTTQLEEGTPVVTPTQDPHDSLRADKNSKVSSNDSSLLRKSPANRMSKMQRMQQRMKGHNHVKRGSPSRSSGGTASAAPSVIQSTATTAVTRNQTQQLQSQSNEQSSQQPRQHDYNFRNNKSGPKHTSQFSPSPPPSPGSKHRIPMDPNGGDHSFINSNNHTISPRSATGTDVLSESQCNIVADASVDPPTDDDATLTSVRRIMENTTSNHHNRQQQQTHYSPSNHSHQQYQSLQAHRKQRGRNESNDYQKPNPIGRKNTNNTYSSNNNSNAFSSNGSYSRNRLQQEYRNGHKVRRHRDWLDEEKSEKEKHRGGVFRTASSSDYDTDGDLSKTSNLSHNNIDNNALDGPSQSQATDVNDFFAARLSYTQPNHKRGITEDDERTFDYGDRDDDSNGSASYATRKLKEAQRRALREEQGKEPQSATFQTSPITELPLLNKDDIEHYKKSMDTPAVKMGAGVAGIATLGCLVFGPLGLLAGAAAVGIGVGVMKLPEEKRSDMQDRATKAMNEFQEKAMDVSDNLSNSCATSSCATTYKESGVAEHFPPCFDLGSDLVENAHESMTQSEIVRGGKNRNPVGSSGGVTKSGAKHPSIPSSKLGEGSLVIPPTSQASSRMRNKKKVACLRNVQIVPVFKIHGLDPGAQPRAWLDVMASANTSDDEKNEAMEEILILAKDKRRARIFLDEGILDSIMWILSRYFDKLNNKGKDTNWAHPVISGREIKSARLAANCCVTLGKSHCAAIHTEGDLLLMSLYERGTVPEERQVAQMLHEVPHHARVTNAADPTNVDPLKEVFALKQMTLPQAEQLAGAIKDVADCR